MVTLNAISRRSIWAKGEDIACLYLLKRGYTIIERNFQLKGGEIDIIAQDGEWTVFVEVRYRKNDIHAHPLDTFSIWKRRVLKRATFFYIQKWEINPENIRIDFIGIMPKKDGTFGHHLWHIKWVEMV